LGQQTEPVSDVSGQIPKNHHFTPIFYLTAWAGADGRVIRYNRPRDMVEAKPRPLRRTGSAEHLYTLQGVPPERQAMIETEFFKPVDDRAAVAHRLLLDGKLNALTVEQRSDWARFMMSMQLRSPFSLGELERLADKVMRETMAVDDAEFNAVRKAGDPATIYDWTAKHEPHVIANAHKTFLPGAVDHEELGQFLINMHWATFDLASAKHTLLTGDRPLVSTHGWKDSRTVLMFPLSPTLAFIATNGMRQTLHVLGLNPSTFVSTLNDQVARCAVDFVIGRDASHLAFVEKRLRRPDVEPIPGPVGRGRPGCPT
jgi:hypothetical protein